MSLVSSLNVGVSSLRAYSEGIQVVSNNIANVNTVGYKASHAQYSDTFSNLLKPLVPNESNTAVKIAPTQIGGGVQVESVSPVFSQGTIQTTSSNSDLAIAGNGFFRVRNTQTGEVFVTRAGNFRVDADGYMVTQQGYRVQGAVGSQTKVYYDSTTGAYDVKGPQDNEAVTIPQGINMTPIKNAKTTLGMTKVLVDSISGLQEGMPVSGSGIPLGAVVVSIDGSSSQKSFTISGAATASTDLVKNPNGVTLMLSQKTMDSGSLTLTLPADYKRSDLVPGTVIMGAGIANGTSIASTTGNYKKTIPASSAALTLTNVQMTSTASTLSADSVDGLAAGMILSAGVGGLNGLTVASVSPSSKTFTVVGTPTLTVGASGIAVVAAGGRTLDQASNIINIPNTRDVLEGDRISGEGIPSPAFVGEIAQFAGLDSNFGVKMVSHKPVTFTGVTIAAGATAGTSSMTLSDTSGLKTGDVVTTDFSFDATNTVSWTLGSKDVTISAATATAAGITDGEAVWFPATQGIPFGATGVYNAANGKIVLSAPATGTGTSSASNPVLMRREIGTVSSVDSVTAMTMKRTAIGSGFALPATSTGATIRTSGPAVNPVGNSYGSVNLAFGDSTVTLTARPVVDSYEDVTISLGTFYKPASTLGDVKVAFDEGSNYDFYGMNGVKLSGIPLAAAQTGAPKIRSFNVGTAGDINVILSNGQSFTAGKVLLMSFRDPGALTREGDNLYSGLYTAGPYNGVWADNNLANFVPSFKGLGSIAGGALELSNVDIGEEFATMITTQRAFQAGSRVISTADQMLEEAVNLKR